MQRLPRTPAAPILATLGLSLAATTLPFQTHAATLYGVTATDLVTINTSTGATTPIGSLGLSANQTAGPLAWHPTESQLYGLVYDYVLVGDTPVPTSQRFVRINPTTGATTVVTTLGSPASGPTFDAIEYFNGLGSLVVSRSAGAGQTSTPFLETINTSGTRSPLVTTTIDNDLLAYDAANSRAFSIDPNGLQEVRTLNLATGTHTSLTGGLPSTTTGELAYDIATDRLYALDYTVLPTPNKSLYSIDAANGVGPISYLTAATTDVQVRGIAFAAVPEPVHAATATASLAAFCVAIRTLRRRQRPGAIPSP